jgi:hypothetical protein
MIHSAQWLIPAAAAIIHSTQWVIPAAAGIIHSAQWLVPAKAGENLAQARFNAAVQWNVFAAQ